MNRRKPTTRNSTNSGYSRGHDRIIERTEQRKRRRSLLDGGMVGLTSSGLPRRQAVVTRRRQRQQQRQQQQQQQQQQQRQQRQHQQQRRTTNVPATTANVLRLAPRLCGGGQASGPSPGRIGRGSQDAKDDQAPNASVSSVLPGDLQPVNSVQALRPSSNLSPLPTTAAPPPSLAVGHQRGRATPRVPPPNPLTPRAFPAPRMP